MKSQGRFQGIAMRPARSPWPIFRIASIAVFLVSVDATVLYAAFPALRRAFSGATAADLSWVLNAYTVVYAALLVPGGRIADLRGRKRMFLVGLGVFLVASLCCGLADSVPPARFGVGRAVNQAVRQMGAVLGVALTVALVGHTALARSDFRTLYACQIALAVLTAVLCAPVDTRPRR